MKEFPLLMYWVVLFYAVALVSPLLLKLPTWLWRTLFVLPYLGALGESLKPFIQQEWPFPRDGLSDFFACIVTGIGVCVCIYSGAYFKGYDRRRFFPLLFAFTGSMLGILWADHIFVFYGFWEATTIISFLLVGFKYSNPEVLKGAKKAIIVNIAGGLCLLLAILIMYQQTGSTSLADILDTKKETLRDNNVLMLMIMLAAMIKSAQWPFHFWLPGAMVAPSPASCYLHSATMVKLGVLLLARMSPVFEENADWILVLSLVGAVTLIWGMIASLTKTDLKQLFAWTTVSSLGGMCILVGLHVSYSWRAFFSYLLAHSLYKASLFLCVGNIDKQMGGRSFAHITGLARRMPMTSGAMLLALGSMIGLPFSMGFLGKEYLYKSALQLGIIGIFLILALLGASVISIIVAYRVILLIFSRQSDKQNLQEVAPLMWAPPLVLASLGWMAGFFLNDINKYFLSPVVSAIMLQDVEQNLEMWSGFNLALILSLVSMGLGFFLAHKYERVLTRAAVWFRSSLVRPAPRIGFVGSLAKKIMDRLQNGRLSYYVNWGLVGLFVISIFVLPFVDIFPSREWSFSEDSLFILLAFAITAAGLGVLVFARESLFQIIALGILGFGVSLFYLSFGATDLVMTLLAVETLSVALLTLAIIFLRSNPGGFSGVYQLIRSVLTAATFIGALMLCSLLDQGKHPSRLANYFTENAGPLGKGLNVVNVILVDFRALDTFGEITVLAIAAFGVTSLLVKRRRMHWTLSPSPLLRISMKVCMPIFFFISVFLIVRGHNSPGGGFVGGLLWAVSNAFYSLVYGESATRKRLILSPTSWMVVGLFVALVAGSFSIFSRDAFMTASWMEGSLSWIGTPLIFDIGVYLLVLGMGMSLFFALYRKEL